MELKEKELLGEMFEVSDSLLDKVKKSIKTHLGKAGGLRSLIQKVTTECEGHRDFKTGPQSYMIIGIYLGARLQEYQKKHGFAGWLDDNDRDVIEFTYRDNGQNNPRYYHGSSLPQPTPTTTRPLRARRTTVTGRNEVYDPLGLSTEARDVPRHMNRATRRRPLQAEYAARHPQTVSGFSTVEYRGEPVMISREGETRPAPRTTRQRGLESLLVDTPYENNPGSVAQEIRRVQREQERQAQEQIQQMNNSMYGDGLNTVVVGGGGGGNGGGGGGGAAETATERTIRNSHS